MLQFEIPQNKNPKFNRVVRYWIVIFRFPNLQPIEFRVRSIPELSVITGIPVQSLKRIIYDNKYNTKKYADFLKYCEFNPIC